MWSISLVEIPSWLHKMCVQNDTTSFLPLNANNSDLVSTEAAVHLRQQGIGSVLAALLYGALLSSALPGLLVTLSWLLWLLYYARCRSSGSKLPLPPGSMGLPFIGETLTFFFLGSAFYRKRRKLYGDVFKTHLLGRPVVRVVGAENVRKVLMGEHTLVSSFWPASVRIVLGQDNITMSTGKRHKILRRIASKMFTHDALSHYAVVMQQLVQDCVRRWSDVGHINGHKECSSLTFFVVCRALLGLHHLSQHHTDHMRGLFDTMLSNMFSLPYHLPGCGLSKGLRARNMILQKIEESILNKKPGRASDVTPPGHDPLWVMMQMTGEECEHQLTQEELKGVCLDLMFAGYSTMGSACTSLFYFLGKNPRVVKRILQELDENGLKDSEVNDLTYDTLSKLTYVGHVVKEILRMAPPVGGGFRKVIKTFELDGYQVPEGWTVSYSIRETQAFSQLFTDAEKFEPERWEKSIQPGEESFHFLPFGGGPRTCVGKEYAKLLLKIVAVEVCRGCHWRLLNEDAKMKEIPVPHFQDGLPLYVTPRFPDYIRPRAATV